MNHDAKFDSKAAAPTAASAAIDTQARWVLVLLLASGLVWFVGGSLLLLIHSIQTHTPSFLARHECFTFGRVQAAAESALVFGWVANAGFAVAWWLLGRLGGEGPRGLAGAFVGTLFWNTGVTIGVGGILSGQLGPYALLQMPAFVLPLLGIAYVGYGVAAFAAWIDRRRPELFAAQWYAVLAVLALPWFYSVAYGMLSLYPVAGASQAVVAAWSAEGLRLLWIAPMALAAAYYLVPKITGVPLAGYRHAYLGFWALVLFGPWVGTRSLAGGPVPVWLPTLGISLSVFLLLHYGVVASNMKAAFRMGDRSQALRFVLLGVGVYVALGLLDTVAGFRSVAEYLQFTFVGEARLSLFVFGVFSPVVFAAIYFMVPRITGRPWASDGLIWAHFRALWLGLVVLGVGLIGAGVVHGTGLVATRDPAGVITADSFAILYETTRPWLLVATHGIGLQLLGGILLLANVILHCVPAPAVAQSEALSSAHAS